jgi:hypothetical protein
MAVNAVEAVQVRPITDADVGRVADFLHAQLNSRISPDHWADAIAVPWEVESPNAGFMLLDDDAVVGVQLAFYSERTIEERRERFCNLGAWCVLPEYRFHALRLLRSVLKQEGYHFTDLSPSGNVVKVNERLHFSFLDTTTALVPNLPWLTWPRRDVISSDPKLIEATLTGRDLDLYRDHAATGAARHLVLIRGDEWCYVIFRKDRRKRLPFFATLLHVSNPVLLRAMARAVERHLLIHHRALATLAEERIVGQLPGPRFLLRSPRRKMFRSPSLSPAQVDYLYSELVCVAW